MAIPPIDPNNSRDSLRTGRITDGVLLVSRIDRLLQLLERRDIPPQQRARLLSALNDLQQQHALLKELDGKSFSSQMQGKSHSVAPRGQIPAELADAKVSLGETGKVMSQHGEMEKALEVKSGLDKTLDVINRPAPDVRPGTVRAAESYLAVAAQAPVPGTGDETKTMGLQSVEPRPVFGLIPQQWLSGAMQMAKRLPGGEFLLFSLIIVLILAALFLL